MKSKTRDSDSRYLEFAEAVSRTKSVGYGRARAAEPAAAVARSCVRHTSAYTSADTGAIRHMNFGNSHLCRFKLVSLANLRIARKLKELL